MHENYESILETFDESLLLKMRDANQRTLYLVDKLRHMSQNGKWYTGIIAMAETAAMVTPLAPSLMGKLMVAGGAASISAGCAVVERMSERVEPDIELELRAVERVIDRRNGMNPELNA
jgi:hypothetical protein